MNLSWFAIMNNSSRSYDLLSSLPAFRMKNCHLFGKILRIGGSWKGSKKDLYHASREIQCQRQIKGQYQPPTRNQWSKWEFWASVLTLIISNQPSAEMLVMPKTLSKEHSNAPMPEGKGILSSLADGHDPFWTSGTLGLDLDWRQLMRTQHCGTATLKSTVVHMVNLR